MGRALMLAAMCLAVTLCSQVRGSAAYCSNMTLFDRYIQSCKANFRRAIHDTATRSGRDFRVVLCSWPDVIQPYFELTNCYHLIAKYFNCTDDRWHILRDDVMLGVHREFFGNCNGTVSHEPDTETDKFLQKIAAASSVTCAFVTLLIVLFITGICSPKKYIKNCWTKEDQL